MSDPTVALVVGFLVSVLTEIFNRLTPNTKFRPQVLQAIALTLVGVGIVGYRFITKGPADATTWAVIPEVLVAWGVALAAHDVASPRS